MWIVLVIFIVLILIAPKLAELHEEFHRHRQRGFRNHEHPSDAMASGGVPAAIAR
jgi:hypothetical protein